MRYHEWLTAPYSSNGDFGGIVHAYLHEFCGASLSAAKSVTSAAQQCHTKINNNNQD